MSTRLSSAYVEISADTTPLERDVDTVGSYIRHGLSRSAREAGVAAAAAAARGWSQDSSGRWREANGRYVSASSLALVPGLADVGERAGGAFSQNFRRAGMAGITAFAALAGTALTKGFNRLSTIEQSEARLRALGNSAEEIQRISDNAMAAVEGTAFGFGDAVGVASMMVAAGVQSGTELEGVLKTVANTAALAGADLGEMGSIFGKAAAMGKIDGEIMSQLLERQIGLLPALSEAYGVSSAEMNKMVSEGKVGFGEFIAVMGDLAGTASSEMGKTVTGSLANVGAALGQVGAAFLQSGFEQMPGVFQGTQNALKLLKPAAVEAGAALGSGVGEFSKTMSEIDWGEILGPTLAGLALVSGMIVNDLIPAVWGFASALAEDLWPVIQPVMTALAVIGAVVWSILIPALTAVTNWMTDNMAVLSPFIGGILAAVVAFKAYSAAVVVAGTVTRLFGRASLTAGIQAAAGWLLAMGPVGLVIAAVAGVVAAFAIAWKNSETFRDAMGSAWEWIANAAKASAQWIADAWSWMGDALGKVFSWISGVAQAAWNGLAAGVQWVAGLIAQVFTWLPNQVQKLLGGWASSMVNAGKNLMGGLLDGITTGFGWIMDKMGVIGDWIASAVNKILGLVGKTVDWAKESVGEIKESFSSLSTEIKEGLDGLKTDDQKLELPELVVPEFDVGSLAGSLGTDLGSAADLASTNAKPKFTAASRRLLQAISDGWIKGDRVMTKGMTKSLQGLIQSGEFKSWTGRISEAIANAFDSGQISKAQKKSMDSAVKETTRAMGKITRQYAKAAEKLQGLRSSHRDMVASVRDDLVGQFNLLESWQGTEGGENMYGFSGAGAGGGKAGISASVKGLAQKARTFAGLVKRLADRGFPNALIQQVVGLGFDDGSGVAKDLLSMNSSEQASLKTDWSAFTTASKEAGKYLADSFYLTGIRAQEGIIKGLLKKDTLTKASKSLARMLTKDIRRELGIKSPSKVMEDEVGIYAGQGVGEGMVKGVLGYGGEMTDALKKITEPPAGPETLAPLGVGGTSSAAVTSAPTVTLSEEQITALADAVSSRRMDLTVEVGASRRTKALWHIEGQQAAEELK